MVKTICGLKLMLLVFLIEQELVFLMVHSIFLWTHFYTFKMGEHRITPPCQIPPADARSFNKFIAIDLFNIYMYIFILVQLLYISNS